MELHQLLGSTKESPQGCHGINPQASHAVVIGKTKIISLLGPSCRIFPRATLGALGFLTQHSHCTARLSPGHRQEKVEKSPAKRKSFLFFPLQISKEDAAGGGGEGKMCQARKYQHFSLFSMESLWLVSLHWPTNKPGQDSPVGWPGPPPPSSCPLGAFLLPHLGLETNLPLEMPLQRCLEAEETQIQHR